MQYKREICRGSKRTRSIVIQCMGARENKGMQNYIRKGRFEGSIRQKADLFCQGKKRYLEGVTVKEISRGCNSKGDIYRV